MKILHVIDTLGIGGAEQALVNLLPELVSAGDQAHVAVLRAPHDLENSLQDAGIVVHRLPSFGKWRLLTGAQAIGGLAQTLSVDIIHAHLLFPGVYTGLARMLSLTRARTCITYHNMAYAPGCNRPGPGLALRKALNRLTSRFGIDTRFAVSDAVARHYDSHLHPGPIHTLHNPLPVAGLDALASSCLPSATVENQLLKLVLPGRLVHEKGHSVLIDALVQCRHAGFIFTTTFAGDGPLRQELEQRLREADIAATITGRLPHAEMLQTLAGADIVVIPSRFEGFGITAAEAMALCRAVIASDAGGLPDVIGNPQNGLLFECENASQLAADLQKLAANPDLRHQMGVSARRRIKELFDAPVIAGQIRRHYQELLKAT